MYKCEAIVSTLQNILRKNFYLIVQIVRSLKLHTQCRRDLLSHKEIPDDVEDESDFWLHLEEHNKTVPYFCCCCFHFLKLKNLVS